MITIVTKSYCPYCSGAKQFLDAMNLEYTEVEVSHDRETYEKYQEISGMRTVPQIFIGEPSKDTLVGGYDEMMTQYKAGEIFN